LIKRERAYLIERELIYFDRERAYLIERELI